VGVKKIMDKNFIFITGGRRSGKSAHALKLAEQIGEKRLYIATAQALDDEMKERIERHRKERGDGWETLEEPIHVARALNSAGDYDVILLDCLTLWLCNIMDDEESDAKVLERIGKLVEACNTCDDPIVVISNETGSGIIPDNTMSRRFSDMAGIMNQKMAAAADRVILTVSGIPLTIKG